MPPKIDKSHGFMKSIIQNQVSRDQYDKEQREQQLLKQKDEGTVSGSSPTSTTRGSNEPAEGDSPATRRRAKRASTPIYVPPHLKNRGQHNVESCHSPEPNKRTRESNAQKRTRRQAPDMNSKVIFQLEYENDVGDVKCFDVQEDDNPEDLAEIFGNQLGLTKPLKNALKHKLNHEITRFTNNDDS